MLCVFYHNKKLLGGREGGNIICTWREKENEHRNLKEWQNRLQMFSRLLTFL